MSEAIPPLQSIGVLEPRCELNNQRQWAILKGGQSVTPYRLPTTSYSNSNWNWTVIPPSKSAILDRVVVVHAQCTINFTGTTSDGSNLLQPGRCGLRSHPINRMISQLSVSMNGYQTSIESQQIIGALERVKTPLEFQRTFGSIFAQMKDNYAVYGDGTLANNNPLGTYADNPGEQPRGAYRMNVVSNTTTAAQVIVDLYEYLILPPLLFGSDECGKIRQAGGFTHLDNFVISAALNQSLARIWCNANPGSGTTPSTTTLTAVTVNVSANPELYVNWITPRLVEPIPEQIVYPFQQINRYTLSGAASLAPNASATITSNVIQFASVPLKLYIFARRSDQDILSTVAKTVGSTDTFAVINNISVSFNNIAGLLSQASPMQLYQMSLQNGLSMSWDEFCGYTQVVNSTSGQPTKIIGTAGSMLVIDPAKDFGLESTLADGSLGQFNFQISQMNITNQNQYDTIPYDLYIIAVYDGIMTLSNNSGTTQIGVHNKMDVLNAPDSDLSYNELTSVYGGGSFFSTLGDIAKRGVGFLRDSKLISHGLSAIPNPTAQAVGSVARTLGFGEDAGASAGILMGGKPLSKKMMRQRLNY